MNELNWIPVKDSGVISRIIEPKDGGVIEAVLLLPMRGQVKILNEVGARIWFYIDDRRSAGQIAELIQQEFQVQLDQAQADVLDFLRELETRKVLTFRQALI